MKGSSSHHIPYIGALLAAAGLLMAGGGVASDDSAQPAALSHLTPHIAAERLSHLHTHGPGLPPPALLVPLGNGVDGVLKGVSLADEARLIDELIGAELTHQILRVGVARAVGRRMAVIKLQAGDKATGAFSLPELRADVAKCLATAFTGPLQVAHLDLWAVVPGAEFIGEEQENLPVFSLSADRRGYERAVRLAGDAGEVLAELDAVRYSPLFLRYVTGPEGLVASDSTQPRVCPRSAFCDPELQEQWESLVARARSAVASARTAGQEQVNVLFHGERVSRSGASAREGGRPLARVALTIDDGPHPLITPLVLAILAEKNVKATFFVVGKKAEQYPGLLRMIARGGHELGNHAYSNRRLHDLSAAEAWAEVEACGSIVARLTGRRMRYFRPPGGGCSPDGLRVAGWLGYTTVFWTRNTGDWRKPPAEEIVRSALTNLTAGDIILMHEGDMCSVRALPAIIDGIRDLGLEPTTIGEIDRNGATVRDTPEALTELVNSRGLGRE